MLESVRTNGISHECDAGFPTCKRRSQRLQTFRCSAIMTTILSKESGWIASRRRCWATNNCERVLFFSPCFVPTYLKRYQQNRWFYMICHGNSNDFPWFPWFVRQGSWSCSPSSCWGIACQALRLEMLGEKSIAGWCSACRCFDTFCRPCLGWIYQFDSNMCQIVYTTNHNF